MNTASLSFLGGIQSCTHSCLWWYYITYGSIQRHEGRGWIWVFNGPTFHFPQTHALPVEGWCFLRHPPECERAERWSSWREKGRNILWHISRPLWESLKWMLQNGGLVNLAASYLKERKITWVANIYKTGHLHRYLNFQTVLEKIVNLAMWSWHSLKTSCGRSWAAVVGGILALQVASGPPLCLVLNSVSLLYITSLASRGM